MWLPVSLLPMIFAVAFPIARLMMGRRRVAVA
jgi:hypothetical protein